MTRMSQSAPVKWMRTRTFAAVLTTVALGCSGSLAIAPAIAVPAGSLNAISSVVGQDLVLDPVVGLAAPVDVAVEAGKNPALPTEVKVTTAGGQTRLAQVQWDVSGYEFTRNYDSLTVYGVAESVTVQATVHIIPEGLTYFIDSGSSKDGSAAFDAVLAAKGLELANQTADQQASGGTWGYLAAGVDGTRSSGSAANKFQNGLYGKNNSAERITYVLPDVAEGTYTVTSGATEWWSGPRTMIASVTTADGVAADLGAAYTVNGSKREAIVTGTIVQPQDGELRFEVRRSAGTEAPVIAWLAVAAGEIEVPTVKEELATPVASLAAGAYNKAQRVELSSATADAAIFYTLDGSTPSKATGELYTDAITLDSSTTLKAVAFKNGHASAVMSSSYRIEIAPEGGYEAVPVGQTWFDTDGNSIQAHGGGFLQKDGWYYWVGENKAHNGASLHAVSLYRSQDLKNWEFLNNIITTETAGVCETGTYTDASCKIERPKLVYNELTDTYVVWGHWETKDSYSASHLIVATSKTIDGDYEVVRNYRPGVGEVSTEHADPTYPGTDGKWGYGSRDFTVFKDPDSDAAFLISAEDHTTMRVYPLTADYTDVDWENSYQLFIDAGREAPAVVKIDGTYYVLTSGQSGWQPNQTYVASTKDLSKADGWSELEPVGNNTSFASQPTNIMTIEGQDGNRSYIYMGDRWVMGELGASTYVWLPLEIGADGVKLDFYPAWDFDVESGTVTTKPLELVSEGKPVAASAGANPEIANDGYYFNLNKHGESSAYWQPSSVPFFWSVDLEEPTDLGRIDLAWNSHNGSEPYAAYTISGSNDGVTWTKLASNLSNKQVGFTSENLTGTYQHVRVDVTEVRNIHNGNEAAWAAGLVEVQVFAQAPEVTEPTPEPTPDPTPDPTPKPTPEPTPKPTEPGSELPGEDGGNAGPGDVDGGPTDGVDTDDATTGGDSADDLAQTGAQVMAPVMAGLLLLVAGGGLLFLRRRTA